MPPRRKQRTPQAHPAAESGERKCSRLQIVSHPAETEGTQGLVRGRATLGDFEITVLTDGCFVWMAARCSAWCPERFGRGAPRLTRKTAFCLERIRS